MHNYVTGVGLCKNKHNFMNVQWTCNKHLPAININRCVVVPDGSKNTLAKQSASKKMYTTIDDIALFIG